MREREKEKDIETERETVKDRERKSDKQREYSDVMDIDEVKGHGDSSSNLGWGCLNFT